MKETIEKKKRPVGGDFVIPPYEPDENQEFDKTEYEEDNFYSFLGEDHNHLGEIIKSWESLRFSI